MTIEEAIHILKVQKFRLSKPIDSKNLPAFMNDWSDEKINDYYSKNKKVAIAISFGINALKSVEAIKKAENVISSFLEVLNNNIESNIEEDI